MKKAIGFLLLGVFLCSAAFAAQNTWRSASGGNSTKWNRGANWTLGTVPTSSDTVVIPTTPDNGTGFPVLDVNASAKELVIQSGASLTGAVGFSLAIGGSVSGAGTLNTDASPMSLASDLTVSTFVGGTSAVTVAGNVNVSTFLGGASTVTIAGSLTVTTFNAGTSTIVLNGTSAQSLGGHTFNTLTVNNPSGVTLTGNISTGTLTLTNGVLTTGSSKVTVTGGNVNNVAFTNGRINGEIERPVSKPSDSSVARFYRFTDLNTCVILDSAHAVQTVSIRSFPNTDAPGDPDTVAVRRYYHITTSGTIKARLRLAYQDSELRPSTNEATLSVWRQNPSFPWVDELRSDSSTISNWVEQLFPTLPSGSNWTIAPTGSVLPIQLGSFTGVVLSNGHVRLDWMTLSELNNYGFEVQKSVTGENYQTIPNSFVPGHGTTTEPQYYTYTDVTATTGHWYYRLKQYDLDGTVHYTEGIEIDVLTSVGEEAMPTAFEVSQNYPNPFNPSTTIKFALPEKLRVTVKLYNLLGKEVATLVDTDYTAGRHELTWKANDVASGVYIYRMQAGNFVETRKLTLIK